MTKAVYCDSKYLTNVRRHEEQYLKMKRAILRHCKSGKLKNNFIFFFNIVGFVFY